MPKPTNAFYHEMDKQKNRFLRFVKWIIIGLPIGGLVIAFLYHCCGMQNDAGTNSVISAVRSEEKLRVVTAPLIFISTLITHLFGGYVWYEYQKGM